MSNLDSNTLRAIHEEAISRAMKAASARNDTAALQRLVGGGLSQEEEELYKNPLIEQALATNR